MDTARIRKDEPVVAIALSLLREPRAEKLNSFLGNRLRISLGARIRLRSRRRRTDVPTSLLLS
jgi:hypothetical protein